MKTFQVRNTTRNVVLAREAMLAETFYSRLKGLLGRDSLLLGEGLILDPCRSVHSWFMRFPIDVLFLDRENRVVGTVENLCPSRLSPYFKNAEQAVELPAGILLASGTAVGDLIEIKKGDS